MSTYLQQKDTVMFNSRPGKTFSKTQTSHVVASMFTNIFYFFCPLLTPRPSAEEAIQKMQGHVIGQQAIRISWSKNPGQVKFFLYNLYLYDVEPHITRWFTECHRRSLVFVIGWLRHTSRSKSVEWVLWLRTRL